MAEILLSIKTLDFTKVRMLLAKLQSQPRNESNSQQIALINTAMGTGSMEMIQLILAAVNSNPDSVTGESVSKTADSDSKTGESDSKTGESDLTPQTELVSNEESSGSGMKKSPSFLEEQFKLLRNLVKPRESNSTEVDGNSTLESLPEEKQTLTNKENDTDKASNDRPLSDRANRRRESASLDKRYLISNNRRHCMSREDENPEDRARFENVRKEANAAYISETKKNKDLLKTFKTKTQRKHSVGKKYL